MGQSSDATGYKGELDAATALVLVGDQQCVNRVSRVFQFATHSILALIRLVFFLEIFQIMYNCLI